MMAEGRESPEYSSPAKRLRLDSTADANDSSLSAEVLVSGDSGFSDFPTSSAFISEETSIAGPSSFGCSNPDQPQDEVMGGGLNCLDAADNSSTVSELSDLSGISDVSDQKWRPKMSGSMAWIQKQIEAKVDPRQVLIGLGTDPSHIPDSVSDGTLWTLILSYLSEPPKREKLRHINSILDVVHLLKRSTNIVVLTGAGVSVSCGIPDFRSYNGIYARLADDFPDLPDPQAMFDIGYFRQDPRPFYKFAREIYPGQFKPSPCHRFLKRLEEENKLLRNYTQNIDTLEQVAGIKQVIECHGSFATASCTKCKTKVSSDTIKDDILGQKIPYCAKCLEESGKLSGCSGPDSLSDLYSQGIMKPDIVFFGEGLPDAFHDAMAADKDKCDLLIVIGSSLRVRPVALIPNSIPSTVPQILINREPLEDFNFDVELLGDCDVIVNQLCHLMEGEWRSQCWLNPLNEVTELEGKTEVVNEWDFTLPSTSMESRVEEVVKPILKDRHYSTDSMLSNGDSGISGGSSSVSPTHSDVSSGHDSRQCSTESMRSASCTSPARHMSVDSLGSPSNGAVAIQSEEMFKRKESVADRLQDNTYYFQPPNRYIFPGAEVEESDDSSSRSSNVSSGSEIESEEEDDKTEHQPIDTAPQL
ncbi:Hypothetical predicted protein [Cloeon dipterum]|uniref:protein acetyllysine N-acetyltransferase n=1 Tax=Cloeon dipterum TaxID=197152 RepID=A0A8S1DQT7_9INSE|nr:Hypothetical predicted protein [Cloeon dipterum]